MDTLIDADYQSWANANILESDDILPFEFLLDDSINEWAQHRQLKINEECLTIIRNNVATYQ